MIVYRGIRVKLDVYERLCARIGKSISPKAHRWWAANPRVAHIYATTEERNGISVVLTAQLEGYDKPFATTPDLRRIPAARLTLLAVDVIQTVSRAC